MKSYFVRKSSRPGSGPYAGPTCGRAGVKPGKIYYILRNAERAKQRLDSANPVGFVIETQGTGIDDQGLEEAIVELVQENGRHSFVVKLVAERVGEPIAEVRAALYRLHERGRVCINPCPPGPEESNRIQSCALSMEVAA